MEIAPEASGASGLLFWPEPSQAQPKPSPVQWLPVSTHFLAHTMHSKYHSSKQFLTKNSAEIAPKASGASGLLLPYNSLLKTIRKMLRRPPEPPAWPAFSSQFLI
jgi:hypothetical protein